MKNKIHFGTVVIDKLHMFFGNPDPVACLVASCWESEKDDGEDCEVWIEHYRGHYREKFKNLRDTSRYTVTGETIDINKNITKQLKKIAEKYK